MTKQTVRINRLLTFAEEDIKIYHEILKLFDKDVRVRFDWAGHIFRRKKDIKKIPIDRC